MFALGVAAASICALLQAPSASAGNFGGCNNGVSFPSCLANNSTHYMSYDLTSGWRTATESTRTQSFETTDLTTILTVHDSSDVHYYVETTAGASYIGKYFCATWGPSGICNHAHVAYNGPNGSGLSTSDLQSVACHETGHSVGLRHPEDSNLPDDPSVYQCMVVNGFPRFLGGHNADHINAYYN
jgi:hypothetical protein